MPWNDNAQIEQDLIISRALVAIFSDEFLSSQLAFRGGTALHKLYLSPQPRYSEDKSGTNQAHYVQIRRSIGLFTESCY